MKEELTKKIYIIGVFIPFLLFVVLHFSHTLPSSLLTDQFTSKAKIFQDFAPQGFGFYSKPPTEKGITFESKYLQLPTASPKNYLGLSRFGRAQAIELGKVYEQVPQDYWVSCETEKDCEESKKNMKPFEIDKTEDMKHLFKGEYLIKSQEPISWYFRNYIETTSFDREMAMVLIK